MVYLEGHTGTGKTELAKLASVRLNIEKRALDETIIHLDDDVAERDAQFAKHVKDNGLDKAQEEYGQSEELEKRYETEMVKSGELQNQYEKDNKEYKKNNPGAPDIDRKQWEEAQKVMGNILDNLGVEYSIGIDEAAFYGPKLDIQYKNVFGKEDTIVTIQIDMLLAQKFGMEYTDADGLKKTPYIIHRTSLGCYERTLAYLIERYAGALPLWMMPTQVKVLPITDRAHEYAKELAAKLNAMNIHAETDCRSEKLGYKIREAQLQKIPYMLVIGDRDMENGTVSVRTRKGEDLGAMTPDEFIAKCLMEIATKSREV